jgi:hypothetical protein
MLIDAIYAVDLLKNCSLFHRSRATSSSSCSTISTFAPVCFSGEAAFSLGVFDVMNGVAVTGVLVDGRAEKSIGTGV